MEWIKNNVVVLLAAAFSGVVAATSSLAGHGVISQDLANTIVHAFNPADGAGGGWLLPLLIGFLQRQFAWGPVSHAKAVDEALATPPPGP